MPAKSTGIDWSDLLRRQEAAFAAVDERSRDPLREQAILEERARRLSLNPDRDGAEGGISCLEFLLGGESYAIELSHIAATLPLTDFTPLFCVPAFVLGITILRGRIVSIVDLRRFFELPAAGLSDLNRVILVGDGNMEFGILADRVIGMRTLQAGSLQPPPDTFTGARQDFLAGVTADRLALLDIAKILTHPSLIVHEEAG